MARELSKFELAVGECGGPEAFRAWFDALKISPEEKQRFSYDWEYFARPKQLPPSGSWATWVMRCGRGFGKTLTGAQWIRWRVEKEGSLRIALVAPTAADVRDVMVEGPSGILAISPPENCPRYEPSKRRLTWPTGATATTFSAEEPRTLRGPEYDTAWCDELAHWDRLDETWNNLQFGLRRRDCKCLVTSSPRALAFLRKLEALPTTTTRVGSTYENAANLPSSFLKSIRDLYGGTRLGRQEIEAEILTDNPNALWDQKRIDELRVQSMPNDTIRVVIAVDPAVSANKKSDETGIVAAAIAQCRCRGADEQHAFVFDDQSGIYKPDEWGKKVVAMYEQHLADLVVAEVNQGGDLVENNIRVVDGGRNVSYKAIHASRGKQLRHEPVANLYVQGKVHHVGTLSRLEDQCCQWDPLQSDSPDRTDALTIAITELMVERQTEPATVGMTVYG